MSPITTKHEHEHEHDYDRLKEVKQFDESKIGVKGLVDSGLTAIPRFFHHPPENLPSPKPKTRHNVTIPIIDLSEPRSTVVDQVRVSASTLGFFQIVNHSVPLTIIDSGVSSLKNFFEQSTEYKMRFYHREAGKGAAYSTNFDLYQSKAASRRDTLQVRMSPVEPDWEAVPEMCRTALAEWDKAAVGLGEELMSILCEGLGIKSDRLKEMMSNDEYKSVQHRVLANPVEGARVSIALFFNPSNRDKLYGPFPELVSSTKPAVYREFVYEDYMRRFFTKELDGKTLTNFYKIDNTKA